ncbi:MAG: hypothetical protein HUJ28_11700 [Chromatiales bacterium]|nr:hypothetical protein [Chromatiales bacterium]
MDTEAIEKKLAAARTRLILEKPFLGALVLRLPMIEGNPEWCKTTATDARKFYYNAEFIDHLTLDETQFILAHEALHCALSHFARRQHRVRHRWDLACDYAINPLLIKDGLKPPIGMLHDSRFEGMTAEEIYPSIDDNNNDQPMDQHIYDDENQSEQNRGKSSDWERGDGDEDKGESEPDDQGGEQDEGEGENAGDNNPEVDPEAGGAPQPKPLNDAERETLDVQWQQRLAGAAQQAMQAGKLGGAMARMVDHLLQPQLPWRMLLARYLTSIARDDYSYSRPSGRREGPAIFPSMRSEQIDVVVALDISGSIGEREMGEFVSEIDAIKSQMRARITLVACDAELAEGCPWRYEPWEEFSLPKQFKGGGGTSFSPVFEWAERLDRQPDILVYFTDAEGQFPEHEPPYPVIWLIKGKAKVPWGTRIQLN